MNKTNVKDALIKCAIEGKTIDFRELVSQLNAGIFDWGVAANLVNIILPEIGNQEYKMGRPLINCLVVEVKIGSIPGWKFYNWYSTTFKKEQMNSFPERKQLHDSLIAECHEYWRNRMPEMA